MRKLITMWTRPWVRNGSPVSRDAVLNRPSTRTLNGVRPEPGQEEQRDAEVGDGQADHQDQGAHQGFFRGLVCQHTESFHNNTGAWKLQSYLTTSKSKKFPFQVV